MNSTATNRWSLHPAMEDIGLMDGPRIDGVLLTVETVVRRRVGTLVVEEAKH